eukprot:5281011-Amphidinium_carterae.1
MAGSSREPYVFSALSKYIPDYESLRRSTTVLALSPEIGMFPPLSGVQMSYKCTSRVSFRTVPRHFREQCHQVLAQSQAD